MISFRLKQLQKQIENPILIKKKENLFYLTGRAFDVLDEEYLLVLPLTPALSRKGRGRDLVVGFGSGLGALSWVKKSDRLKNIGKYLKKGQKLDIEYGFTYGEGEYLKYKIKDLGLKIEVKPKSSLVDEMREVKTQEEIGLVKKSMQIVEKVFGLVRKEILKPNLTEKRLAEFIETSGLKLGAGGLAFPAIVASGKNAAVPHHLASNKKLKAGEPIILDFGFKYKNYCSDFTRTVFLKKVQTNLETAYNQTEKAYLGSMDFINNHLVIPKFRAAKYPKSKKIDSRLRGNGGKRGNGPWIDSRMTRVILAGQVYDQSVKILAEKGLDKYFIHSLGHGTGLEIHEKPNLSPQSRDILKNNMVFSIEPGVYIEGVGGIRIEDLVFLENNLVNKFINVPTKLIDNIF
jgi:Xaa-Pro aminopeptidase